MAHTGSVTGTVKNNHGEGQPGATITVQDTNLFAVTGIDGSYQLHNVPVGIQHITVDDVLAKQTKTAEISESGAVVVDFVINPLN